MVPTITSTSTPEDVADAKNQTIKRLDEISFVDDEEKVNITKYLKSEDTIIDFSDVEQMLKQIAIDQIEKKKQNENENNVSNKSKA